MSLNLNKVVLGGRLTADPELRKTTQNTSVTAFTIAINRPRAGDGQNKADFINCVAWRQTAEFITQYFRKGSSICVIGSIQTRNWVDQNTQQKRYATEVVVDEATFVESKSENPTAPVATPNTTMPTPTLSQSDPDDDLPF